MAHAAGFNLNRVGRSLAFAAAFGLIGLTALIATFAATASNAKIAEGESGVGSGINVTVVGDTGASGDNYLRFDAAVTPPPPPPPPPTPPATGVRPTRDNTGPRFALTNISADQFFSSRSCNRQRISGDLSFDAQWMMGQTFTLTDCEITGTLRIYVKSGMLSLAEMPIITMDYVDVGGGMVTLNAAKLTMDHSYIDGGTQLSLDDVWAPFVTGPAPMTFTNTVFYGPYFSQPTHAEPLHAGDYGTGYRFTNVAFLQQSGPLNNTGITATINFHGMDTIFDGCWFVWEGAEVPAYITAYLDAGSGSIIRNSKFSSAPGGYIYNASTYNPTFQNNTDVVTGAPVSLSP